MDSAIWKHPEKEKSLDQSQTPLWFWNDQLESEELIRQLELMSSAFVKCAAPHARTNGGEGFIGGYLDEEWFAHIRDVLEYKKEKGEPAWLYDEIDWPAGTCGQSITKDERNREQYLTFETVRIPAGERFRAQLAELRGRSLFDLKPGTDKRGYAFNVFILDEETQIPYDITSYFQYLMFGPELEFCSDKDAVAHIIKICVDPYDQGGNESVNYLDAAVTEKFIKSTYDVYYENCKEYFGDTIQAVFNDETRMCHAFAWCKEFPEVFLEQKGYDLMQKLYLLPTQGQEAGRVRCDYFDVLAGLFQKNYFKVLNQWCNDHSIKLFAHLLGEETMFGHVRYSGDYLRQNRYLDIAGADHLGKGIGSLNIKFTSCGAHSYGKELTGVEVFAGCGWDLTFEEYIRMITWMYQQGMQMIINHGFFYSDRGNRKNDWPPSQFFQWKGFERMPEGNRMVRRLSYALTGGYNEADILIYHPIESFWLNYLPDNLYTHGFFRGSFLRDQKAEKLDREIQLLLNGLIEENLDFDLLHKDALENFYVEDGKLKNRLSGQSFSALIFPMCEVLPLEAAMLAKKLLGEGGVVYLLDEIPYLSMKREDDQRLRSLMGEIMSSPGCIRLAVEQKEELYHSLHCEVDFPVQIVEGNRKNVNLHPCYDNYLIDPYIHTGEDVEGVMFTRYCKDGERRTLFMNYGKEEELVTVFTRTSGEIPQVWDTFTGEISNADVIRQTSDGYDVRLKLPCTHGVFLVTKL